MKRITDMNIKELSIYSDALSEALADYDKHKQEREKASAEKFEKLKQKNEIEIKKLMESSQKHHEK